MRRGPLLLPAFLLLAPSIARAQAVNGDVALFGHGHMFRVLAATWLAMEPQRGRSFALGTGTVSVLGHERETRVLQRWNETPERLL